MMKNAFYFTLEALLVLKIFKLLSQLFDHVEKTACLEDKVNFKICEVTIELTNNCNTHSDQYLKKAAKLGQLIEYNMRKIFLEKPYTKCGGKLFSKPFLKNQNQAYLWINSLKFYKVCFHSMPS